MEKHFFAGTNASVGFYSYFDHILSPKDADRIYILKGGPGVGKSSFMKKAAGFFKQKGIFLEYIHCSTDYNSLDGIHVPDYKLMMIDGTAPHVVEPMLPCLVDEILDFGKYLKRDSLLEHRDKIIEISQEKSDFYKSGYRNLKMAGIILEEISDIYSVLTNSNKRCIIEKSLILDLDQLLRKVELSNKSGKVRKMFSDSYTPDGYFSFIDKLSKGKEVWEVVSPNYKDGSQLLQKVVSNITIRGFNVEGYYNPLFPEKLQHIYIKELNLIIMSTDVEQEGKADKVYPIYEAISKDGLEGSKADLEKSKKLLDSLLENGMNRFKEAKAKHEVLEKIYIKSMDFDKVDFLYERIIDEYEWFLIH